MTMSTLLRPKRSQLRLVPAQEPDIETIPEETPRQEIMRLLRRAVTMRGPNYHYTKPHTGRYAQYFGVGSSPEQHRGCLVGLLLHLKGLSLKDFSGISPRGAFWNNEHVRVLSEHPKFPASWRSEIELLSVIQSFNDNKYVWEAIPDACEMQLLYVA